MQINFEGKTIDQVAIELIQNYSQYAPLYGGFSGGKDSQAIYDLGARSGVPIEWYYNDSPIDSRDNKVFIRENYPDVTFENRSQGYFGRLFLQNGAPLRTQRWCCGVIKECGGEGRVKLLGMRQQESNTRKDYNFFMDSPRGGHWLLPIVTWSTDDVWQYLAERGIKPNPLYRLGFERIGCVLCPFAGKHDIQLHLKHFPKIVNAYRNACDRYIKERLNNPKRKKPKHRTGEEYFNWWISRK